MGIKNKLINAVLSNTQTVISSMLKSNLLYRIEISYFGETIDIDIIRKYFQKIPYRLDSHEIEYRNGKTVLQWTAPDVTGTYYDMYMYEKSPIILICNATPVEDKYDAKTSWTLVTLNTKYDKAKLMKFYRFLQRETYSSRKAEQSNVIHVFNPRQYIERMEKPNRSFADVFVPETIKDSLINHIDRFINNKKWYLDHKIPYHFGILLHGSPGTGKSSIIQALINHWNSETYIIPADAVPYASEQTSWFYKNSPKISFVVIEDIDTAGFSEDRIELEYRTKKRTGNSFSISGKEVLGRVLNMMDGLTAFTNVIYIFTTNHLENLDPALIRPGRIDLCLEIDYVCDESMDQFLKFHYGKGLPNDKHVKPNLTFSAIQTLVMMGKSFEELVKEICE